MIWAWGGPLGALKAQEDILLELQNTDYFKIRIYFKNLLWLRHPDIIDVWATHNHNLSVIPSYNFSNASAGLSGRPASGKYEPFKR